MWNLFIHKLFSYRRKSSRSVKLFYDFLILFVLVSIIFILLFKYTEEVSWDEAIWQVWQTATTVGYGNQPAKTIPGRIITMVFGMGAIILMGAATASFLDFREEIRNKRRFGFLKNPHSNSIIIFNFPGIPKILEFEREFRSLDPDVGICIVDNNIQELPQGIAILSNIHFIKGSTIDETTYEKANLKESKAVIVFPKDPNSSESDASTMITVNLVEKFINVDTRVVYILVDQRNAWMFKDSKATSIIEGLEILALVQECQDKYSAPIIQQLLSNIAGANPITVKPNLIVGWQWGDLDSNVVKAAKALGTRVNTLALVKNGIPETCPDYETVIEKDDHISIIAYNGFAWGKFEEQLIKLNRS
jgi:voltage-gated potassium channel Kch